MRIKASLIFCLMVCTTATVDQHSGFKKINSKNFKKLCITATLGMGVLWWYLKIMPITFNWSNNNELRPTSGELVDMVSYREARKLISSEHDHDSPMFDSDVLGYRITRRGTGFFNMCSNNPGKWKGYKAEYTISADSYYCLSVTVYYARHDKAAAFVEKMDNFFSKLPVKGLSSASQVLDFKEENPFD